MTTYKSIVPEIDKEGINAILEKRKVDVLTFTSSSTVRNFVQIAMKNNLPVLLKNVKTCIGPVTEKTSREYKINVDVIPEVFTMACLLNEISEYFIKSKNCQK